MLNLISNLRNANENNNEIPFAPTRLAKVKKSDDSTCCCGRGLESPLARLGTMAVGRVTLETTWVPSSQFRDPAGQLSQTPPCAAPPGRANETCRVNETCVAGAEQAGTSEGWPTGGQTGSRACPPGAPHTAHLHPAASLAKAYCTGIKVNDRLAITETRNSSAFSWHCWGDGFQGVYYRMKTNSSNRKIVFLLTFYFLLILSLWGLKSDYSVSGRG